MFTLATDFEAPCDGHEQTHRRPIIRPRTEDKNFLDRQRIQAIWRLDGFNKELHNARMNVQPGEHETMFLNLLCVFAAAGPHSDPTVVNLPTLRRLERVQMLGQNCSIVLEYIAICISLFQATLAFVSRLDSDDTDGGAKESACKASELFFASMNLVTVYREQMAKMMFGAIQSVCEDTITRQTCAFLDDAYKTTERDINFALIMLVEAARTAGVKAAASAVGLNVQHLIDMTMCRSFSSNTKTGTTTRLTGLSTNHMYTIHHQELLRLMQTCGVHVTLNCTTQLGKKTLPVVSLANDAMPLELSISTLDKLDDRQFSQRLARTAWCSVVCLEVETRTKRYQHNAKQSTAKTAKRIFDLLSNLIDEPEEIANKLAQDVLVVNNILCVECSNHKRAAKATHDQAVIRKAAFAIAAHNCNNRKIGPQSCRTSYFEFEQHAVVPTYECDSVDTIYNFLQMNGHAAASEADADVVEYLSAILNWMHPNDAIKNRKKLSWAMQESIIMTQGLHMLADLSRGWLRKEQIRANLDLVTVRDLVESLVAGCTNQVVHQDTQNMDTTSIIRSDDGRSVLLPGTGAVSHVAGRHISECSMTEIASLVMGTVSPVAVTISPPLRHGGFQEKLSTMSPVTATTQNLHHGWSYKVTISLFDSAIQELTDIRTEQHKQRILMKRHRTYSISLPGPDTWTGASPQSVYGNKQARTFPVHIPRCKETYHAYKTWHHSGCVEGDCPHHKQCISLSDSVKAGSSPRNDFHLPSVIGIRQRPRRRLSAHAMDRSCTKHIVVPPNKDCRKRPSPQEIFDAFDAFLQEDCQSNVRKHAKKH